MIRPRKPATRLLASFASATVMLLATAIPTGADDPHQIADERFAAMDGPMVPFVVKPADFGIDATRTLTDVPPLLAQVDPDRLQDLTTQLAGYSRSSSSTQTQIDAATAWVTDQFTDLGYDPQLEPVTHEGRSMPNISVTIPGTGCSDKVLQLSAHYDVVGATNPGADDDASGMAALLEIARILRDHPQPVTIRLVAFSFEENGLVGAFQMAAADAAAHTDIVGAVSMDMIGFTDSSLTDPFVGLPADYLAMVADPSSAALAHVFGAASYTYTPEFPAAGAVIDPSVLPDIFRSDHAAFVLQGYPGMIATDTANFRNPNYHTPNDTLATIDWNFVAGSTRAMLAGMVTYASSDQNSDGIADVCVGSVLPTPDGSTTTTTTPAGSTTTTVVDDRGDTTDTAHAATPVSATPAYTG